ncbi:MAG: IPTL-CTERM sorting domain-containing protein, partial [Actinomycetota bacterium]
ATEDGEPDGQPSPAADGDGDDEDGVVIVGGMVDACTTGNALDVMLTDANLTGAALLDAWIDWNGNGTFDHPVEHLFLGASAPLAPGPNALIFDAPCDAMGQSTTYARFRLSSTGGLAPTGPSADGEVEDYITQIQGSDYGDAPSPYPTLLADDGARHTVLFTGNPTLGAAIDMEPDGQPEASHLGDDANGATDDEDGVTLPGVMVPGETVTLPVTAGTTGGNLSAWIDWNRDGDWADPGEQIAADLPIGADGSQSLTVVVPVDADPGASCARFRFSSATGLTSTGGAPDGEVEDYAVAIGVEFPMIAVAKRLVDVQETAIPGTFAVRYQIELQNTGNVPLSTVQATVDLATAYSQAIDWRVLSVLSADLTPNAGYNGASDLFLLAGIDVLPVGALGAIELTVEVTPGSFLGPYQCTAMGSGLSPTGTTVDDQSQNGLDPDPDGDGDPNNNQDPTDVLFPEGDIPEIPTVGEIGLMLLALLLALIGAGVIGRRPTA